jgi:uncharacterized protein (DUF58 family)
MRAWAWVNMASGPVVYPRPAASAQAPRASHGVRPGDGAQSSGDDDFAGLREYRPGDSPRRIAWKSYARRDALLVREYRGGAEAEPVWFDWDAFPGKDAEARVALLARLVIDTCAAGRSWGLRLPDARLAPGRGRDHLHRSLHALAMTGLPR